MRRPLPGELSIIKPSQETADRLTRLRPYIRQSGNNVRPQWHIGSRKLLDYLLVVILSGRGHFKVGETSFTVGPDSVIWIPPDTVHSMSGEDGMHLMYIHFDLIYDPARSHWNAIIPPDTLDLSEYSEIIHPLLEDSVIDKWSGLLDIKEPQKLYQVLRNICLSHRNQANELVLSGMMLELIAGMCAELERANSSDNIDSRVRKAMEWLNCNDTRPFDLHKVSREAGLSASHLRKLFREACGISPRKFHQRCRIARAGQLLIYSDLTVSETAEQLGFGSIYSFSRMFKQETGVSPQQFKTGKYGTTILS